MPDVGVLTARQANHSAPQEIRENVYGIPFCQIGHVAKAFNNDDGYTSRCNVRLPYVDVNGDAIVVKGVEVLYSGAKGVNVRYPLEEGDCVILLAMANAYDPVVADQQPTDDSKHYTPFSLATAKAIPVQASEIAENALFIKYSGGTAEITTKNSVKVTVSGDSSHATVAMTASALQAEVASNSDKSTVTMKPAEVTVVSKTVDINNGHLKVT